MQLFQSDFRGSNWRAWAVAPLYCADLNAVVRRERARADRSGGEFSLLIFSAEADRPSWNLLRSAANHLEHRIRITDQHGWISDGKFWVLLASCSSEFAARMGREVCQQFSSGAQGIRCEVFHYPSPVEWSVTEKSPEHTDSGGGGELVGMNLGKTTEKTPTVESFLCRVTPIWKRAFDLAVAISALVLLSPLLLLIAGLIRATSAGPALYSQMRVGKSGKPFRMYKFRTMMANAERHQSNLLALNEQDGPAFKMRRDPRVTPLGRILRATCVDELPQLCNVLMGDMSLVGPRPLPLHEMAECQRWQRERLDVTPGLTCFWQVRGDRLRIPFTDWMRMDIDYARRQTFWLDLRVVVRTLTFVFGRRGT